MEPEYTARNIYEAAFLYAEGTVLVAASPNAGRSAIFTFDNKDGQAEEKARDYQHYKASPVKAVFEALGRLKVEADLARGRPPKDGR
jgi:hypothetical protein